jgi:hypothetical protein
MEIEFPSCTFVPIVVIAFSGAFSLKHNVDNPPWHFVVEWSPSKAKRVVGSQASTREIPA